MARKSMKMASLFSTKRWATKLFHSCKFLPNCAQASALPFRETNHVSGDLIQTPQSNQFSTSSSSPIELDLVDYCNNYDGECSFEKLVHGVARSSKRLFFEPNGDTSSLLVKVDQTTDKDVSTTNEGTNFQSGTSRERKLKGKEKVNGYDNADEAREFNFYDDSVFMTLDSYNPYEDFKKSFEEMVQFLGLKEWETLEELLGYYLTINEEKNQEFILRAFVELFSNRNLA